MGALFGGMVRSSDRAKTAQAFAMSEFSTTISQLMVVTLGVADA